MRPSAWIAAALLPPLGLHLARAGHRDFWIAAGLTALGFVPGVLYALARLAVLARDATAAA